MNRSETTTRPAGGKSVMLIGAAVRRTFRLPDGIRWEADSARQAKYTALTRPIPMPELIHVVAWSDRLPSVAAAIDVPVRATLAEHDNISSIVGQLSRLS
jgi:hypothetical protein